MNSDKVPSLNRNSGSPLFQSSFKSHFCNSIMDPDKRIKLAKGKQRGLIEKAKHRNNFSWRELSLRLGVCEGYLKNELRNEIRSLKADAYEKLSDIAGKRYDNHIIAVLDRNWGRVKGGKNSIFKPIKPRLLLSKPSKELAEFVGVMLGDGNLQEMPEKSIYQTRVFGHKQDDYEYLTENVCGLFQKLFGFKPSIYAKGGKKVIILSKQSKSLNFTLKYFGLKPGNKVNSGTSIPGWVFKDKNYLRACIGGLIDTDGSIYPKTKKHKTPSIWFSNASPEIRRAFTKALKILGYRVSKWTEKRNSLCQSCSIGNSEDVIKYFKEIGFNNPKHRKRFEKFCSAPIV